jgi:Recombination directionality factor-like
MSKMTMSLLGEKQAKGQMKATMGGSLRPGIKVLTKAGLENPEIVKIYNNGVKELMSFNDIEKEILKKFPNAKNCMYPRNVEYFSVAAKDFPSAAAAKQFIEAFGEDRGDGIKRIYTVPVAFKSDNLEEIFPNTLQGFADGTFHYMVIDESSGKHLCMHRKPIDAEKAKRGKVLPREFSIKSDCVPNECAMYASGRCKFNGSLEFYIPGTTIGLVSMSTSSAYASEDIWAALVQAKDALGHLPALNPNTQKPVFWLRKVECERAYFEKGERKVGKQWSPKLFSELDFAAGVANKQMIRMGLATTPSLETSVVDEDGVIQSQSGQSISQVSEIENQTTSKQNNPASSVISDKDAYQEFISKSGVSLEILGEFLTSVYGGDWEQSENASQVYTLIPKAIARLGNQAEPFMQIRILSKQHNIIPSEFDVYAEAKFGKDWKSVSNDVYVDLMDILRGGEDVAIAIIQEVASKNQAA